MEVLHIEDKKFVKASSIARELGYTTDYVGQLCRGKKVDAQLVGRSWYVSEDSIRAHKNTRYRSTKAKTKKALQEDLKDETSENAHSVPVRIAEKNDRPSHFYKKLRSIETIAYTEDASELIPVLTEKQKSSEYTEIEVRHADEKKVAVQKKEKSYSLKPTKRPKIVFKGRVEVVEPPEMTLEEQQKSAQSDEMSQEKGTPIKKEVTKRVHHIHVHEEGKAIEQVTVHRGAAFADRVAAQEEREGGELSVTSIPERTAALSGRMTFLYVTGALTLAMILAFGLFVADQTVTYTQDRGQTDYAYSFNITAVVRSLGL